MQKNLSEKVALDIRNKILNRTYPPLSRLPNEFELAEQYDVCRYTIREAVKKLVAIGLVTVAQGKGTFVNDVAVSTYFEPIIERLVLIDRDTNEIFEARLSIEVKTAELAAQHASDAEIEEMRTLTQIMAKALEKNNMKEYDRLDLKFHETIAVASRNRILVDILRVLYDMIFYALKQVAGNPNKYQVSNDGHIRILEAIAKRKPDQASKEMYQHLTYCQMLAVNKVNDEVS